MSITSWAIRSFSFPIGLTIWGKYRFYKHYLQLEKNQWLSRDDICFLQFERFKHLISIALSSSPYYQWIAQELNLQLSSFRSIEDISSLPILTKNILQENRDNILIRNASKKTLIQNASGGSTGQPTLFYQDIERNYRRAMDQIRHDRWSGWEIGEPFALLWGANYELESYEKIFERFTNAVFFRRIPLDAFNLTEQKVFQYIEILRKKRPTVIQAYAQALFFFAEFIEREKIDISAMPLKGIISSAEKLYDWQRQKIESVFACKVFDRYGSREVGLVASECNRFEGMHINSDNVIVEIVDENGHPCQAGQSGRIVVTDLWNLVMPFIRYDTGDIGKLIDHVCSCGRSFPLMQCVEGRTADFLKFPNGKIVHGEYFTHLFYKVQGVRKFQVVQDEPFHIAVRVEANRPEVLEQIRVTVVKDIYAFINDPRLKVDLESVDNFDIPRSGKHRFTISYVK